PAAAEPSKLCRNRAAIRQPHLRQGVVAGADPHRGTIGGQVQHMAKTSAAFALALTLAAGLAACATPTPYQPNVPGQATSGGYSELRLEQDRWRVTFAGNS